MKGRYYNQGIGQPTVIRVGSHTGQGMGSQHNHSIGGLGGGYPSTWMARTPWCFNGEFLSVTEFAQRVYGDTPQRTEFLLKYSDSDLKQAR
jgi:hypothetical protein